MCGLFGIIYRDSSVNFRRDALLSSANRLQHRGPDAQGIYVDTGIALAHQRLSLVDLDARSNQPFWDETRRYCLVYNGEIYNFRELRAELEKSQVSFQTTGDTEVLLKCLLHHDLESVLPRLEGMFAFALYDVKYGSLVLARDRFGMKPLYIYDDGRVFAFASEIKAFQPWVTLQTDEFSVAAYLLGGGEAGNQLGFGGPTRGCTFYKNVKSLTPGTVVSIKPNQPIKYSRFFSLSDFCDRETSQTLEDFKPAQMVDTMEALLLKSVQKHMIADSPVGGFCSGGVDSSLLVAMAARLNPDLTLFHANVKGQWSEHEAAAKLAGYLKLELHTVDVNEEDFIDLLPEVMEHYEHPYTYHPNCAPLLKVCKLARDHGIKGLLSGEGSDECFLGYPWLGRERLVSKYYRLLDRARVLVQRVPHLGRILWPHEGNTKKVVQMLLNRCEVAEDEQCNFDALGALDMADRSNGKLQTLDYLHYHLRTLLHRNDSMGMAASIEARFPFLDHEVVKTAVNMPYHYKLRFAPLVFEKAHPWIRDKWIIRKVADRYLPRDLSQRIKIGFWTTAFQRMRVAPAFFEDSFVGNLFSLTPGQLRIVLERADQELTMRLLHLEVWGQVCLESVQSSKVLCQLKKHVTLVPE